MDQIVSVKSNGAKGDGTVLSSRDTGGVTRDSGVSKENLFCEAIFLCFERVF